MCWLDMVVLGYIALQCIVGYVRGLVKTFFGFCGMFIAIIGAIMYFKSLSAYLLTTNFGINISSSIKEKIASIIESADLSSGSSLADHAAELKLPSFIKDFVVNNGSEMESVGANSESIVEFISDKIGSLAMDILSVLIIFIVLRIAVAIVALMLDGVMKAPVLDTVNKIGGGILGFGISIITVMIIFSLITLFGSFDVSTPLGKALSESTIAAIIYENNYLLSYLVRIASQAIVDQL